MNRTLQIEIKPWTVVVSDTKNTVDLENLMLIGDNPSFNVFLFYVVCPRNCIVFYILIVAVVSFQSGSLLTESYQRSQLKSLVQKGKIPA